MNINIAGLDVEKGLDFYDGDEEMYILVLRSYLENTPEVVEKMKGVTKDKLADYTVWAHGVKGTSATIGAEKIRETALKLEMLSHEGKFDEIIAINAPFLREVEKLLADLKAWFAKYDG